MSEPSKKINSAQKRLISLIAKYRTDTEAAYVDPSKFNSWREALTELNTKIQRIAKSPELREHTTGVNYNNLLKKFRADIAIDHIQLSINSISGQIENLPQTQKEQVSDGESEAIEKLLKLNRSGKKSIFNLDPHSDINKKLTRQLISGLKNMFGASAPYFSIRQLKAVHKAEMKKLKPMDKPLTDQFLKKKLFQFLKEGKHSLVPLEDRLQDFINREISPKFLMHKPLTVSSVFPTRQNFRQAPEFNQAQLSKFTQIALQSSIEIAASNAYHKFFYRFFPEKTMTKGIRRAQESISEKTEKTSGKLIAAVMNHQRDQMKATLDTLRLSLAKMVLKSASKSEGKKLTRALSKKKKLNKTLGNILK